MRTIEWWIHPRCIYWERMDYIMDQMWKARDDFQIISGLSFRMVLLVLSVLVDNLLNRWGKIV